MEYYPAIKKSENYKEIDETVSNSPELSNWDAEKE